MLIPKSEDFYREKLKTTYFFGSGKAKRRIKLSQSSDSEFRFDLFVCPFSPDFSQTSLRLMIPFSR